MKKLILLSMVFFIFGCNSKYETLAQIQKKYTNAYYIGNDDGMKFIAKDSLNRVILITDGTPNHLVYTPVEVIIIK